MGTTLSLPIMSLVTSPETTWYRRTLDVHHFYAIGRALGSSQHQITRTSYFWSILHLFQQFSISRQCLHQLGRKLKAIISFFLTSLSTSSGEKIGPNCQWQVQKRHCAPLIMPQSYFFQEWGAMQTGRGRNTTWKYITTAKVTK